MHRFVTCDVFTDTRFGGNPLAVLPDADGLTAAQMQAVAREFNYSETTFVLPPERGGDHRVRIFTPAREVPFAGHPNVGTAFVLARTGALGQFDGPRTVVFEEPAGDVAVDIHPRGPGRFWCELRAPEQLSVGLELAPDLAAAAVSLPVEDIRTSGHAPCLASVGLPFVVVEVDESALGRAHPDPAGMAALVALGIETPDVHLYARAGGAVGPADGAAPGADLCARMFAPLDGVPEDPATGSANGALAGLLAALDPRPDGEFAWRIAQGVEMGRPSLLQARARKRGGSVVGVWIGGESVLVSTGAIEVGAP